MSIADEIFALAPSTAPVRAWGKDLQVQALTLQQVLKVADDVEGDRVKAEDLAQVIVWGLKAKDGHPIFTDDDIPRIVALEKGELMRVYRAIMAVSVDDGDAEGN